MDYMGMSLPGLCIEPLPSGGQRIRVRVKGDRKLKIMLPDGLQDAAFLAAYQAARHGFKTNYRPTTLDVLSRRPGFQGTIFNMLSRAKQRARAKGLQFELSTKDILELLEKQGGKCALSGMKFDIRPHPRKGEKRPFCMSIDRIDNDLGYLKGNVRITTIIVNTARLNWSDEDFRRMCEAVSRAR